MLTLVVGGVVGGVVTGDDEPVMVGVESGEGGDEPGEDGDLLGVNVVGDGGEAGGEIDVGGATPVRVVIISTIIISHILNRYKMN